MTKRYLTSLFIAIFLPLVLMLTGCTTMTVKTEKQDKLDTGSPLKGIKPLKVAIKQFEDIRGVPPDVAGKIGIKTLKLDKPVANTVQETIRREFERTGHVCLEMNHQQDADIVLEGVVYEYAVNHQTGLWDVKVTAKVGTKISVNLVRNPSQTFIKKYDGSDYTSTLVPSGSKSVKILNGALLNMTKEFNTDPELIGFLKQVEAENARSAR